MNLDMVELDRRITMNWDEIPDEAKPKVLTLSNLVLTVIAGIVDHENDVKIKVQANHRRVMFTVRCHNDDVAFAIGGRRRCDSCQYETRGTHANALRTLLIAACRKLHFHFDMDIIGPSGDADWSSD